MALCPFILAETETDVFATTAEVVIGKVAEMLPAGIKRVGGTVVDGSLLKRLTTVPVEGATAVSVTVPVVVVPPVTVLGEIETKWTATDAPIANPELTVLPPKLAEILVVSAALILDVVMGKVTDELPAGINTVEGT